MARTNRRIRNRLPWSEVGYPERYTASAPEKCCDPGCHLCERGPRYRRADAKRRRVADRAAIREQVC